MSIIQDSKKDHLGHYFSRNKNEVAHKQNPEKCVKKAKNRLKLKEMETILR